MHKKDEWKEEGSCDCLLKAKRMLAARHPALEAELENLVSFARHLRLPVTRNLIQEQARISASTLGLSDFKASNGNIEKFTRKSQIKIQFDYTVRTVMKNAWSDLQNCPRIIHYEVFTIWMSRNCSTGWELEGRISHL